MASKNEICVWDFTCSAEGYEIGQLKTDLKERCKKWCFQLEQGHETGYKHYQGRVSLKVKCRNMTKVMSPCHWSPTTNVNMDNEFYVMKEDTRIDGPWSDKDVERYIPRQIREVEQLRPWQQTIIDMAHVWDKRHIHYLYCPNGNVGKTTLCGYIRAHGLGRPLPPLNDMKDLMRIVCDTPTEKLYTIDMPRAMRKEKLYGFYSGVETIKDGYAYDDRYKFVDKHFDCPNIWIFSNRLPSYKDMSNDRWKIWAIQDNQLVEARLSLCNNIQLAGANGANDNENGDDSDTN